MAEDDENEYAFYGKSLEPYEEDAFPSKKPFSVEQQIATDAEGRRRFHGAFTGGFSAGFFNTVGSLEGWKPSEFRSSRTEKAAATQQNPEDFMDAEDLDEFGIAPQIVQVKDGYSKKQRKRTFQDSIIPGECLLQSLIERDSDSIGYILIKNITKKISSEIKNSAKTYGCEMPVTAEILNLAPSYVTPSYYSYYIKNRKVNTFGLGYKGMEKLNSSKEKNTNVFSVNKEKKTFMTGQAFGVGAFEDEDDDIYAKDDMSNYDFELRGEVTKKKNSKSNLPSLYEKFVTTKKLLTIRNKFPPPILPSNVIVNYENIDPEKNIKTTNENSKIMNASVRAIYLGESSNNLLNQNASKESATNKNTKEKDDSKIKNENINQWKDKNLNVYKLEEKLGSTFDRFVSAGHKEENVESESSKNYNTIHGTEQMKSAVKMKMFGPLTRTSSSWQPCSLVCKRFNVPEPFNDELNKKEKKRTKHLVFEYQTFIENDSFKCGLDESLKAKTEEGTLKENKCETLPSISEPKKISIDTIKKADVLDKTEREIDVEKKMEVTDNTEKEIDITDKVDIAKNTDLFKAVFLDSESDDEGENSKVETETSSRDIDFKNQVVEESLLPKFKSNKPGLLSNIDFSELAAIEDTSEDKSKEISANFIYGEEIKEKSKNFEKIDSNVYGPQVPCAVQSMKNIKVYEVPAVDDDSDDWVEKHKHKEKKHKHKKKHKKDKKSKHKSY